MDNRRTCIVPTAFSSISSVKTFEGKAMGKYLETPVMLNL